ncbi:MAG: ferredoxin-thioredoxin reductase catalytic domain-containing protein [Clostridia bacterium]
MSIENYTPTDVEKQTLLDKLTAEAKQAGYNINPDSEFMLVLMEGLLINEQRYGYQACPCRLASGIQAEDLDMICPCDYRDSDLDQYGACYCALYVSTSIAKGETEAMPIPDRRVALKIQDNVQEVKVQASYPSPQLGKLPFPVYRCKVCGYLCARDNPPENCPICKVKKERFERFI